MRPTIAIAASLLALAACRDNDQADNDMNREQTLTAENIVSNDVTAIDAVTADASNMAADVDYADALAELSNNGSESPKSGAKPGVSKAAPGGNAASEAATNSE